MTNPKQRLTQIREVYELKESPTRRAAATRAHDLAADLAATDAVHETDAGALANLEQYSITTVEEVAELARQSEQLNEPLLQNAGVSKELGYRLLQALQSTPQGASEVRDWARYDRFVYLTGLELDFNNPPPDAEPPQALGGPAAAFTAPPAALAATTSLIDQYMSPIRDQANRGTCVAFSSVACLEYYLHRFGQRPELDLSEQFVYWNMVMQTGQHNLQSAFPQLVSGGSCLEATWPYVLNEVPNNDAQDPPPPTAVSEALGQVCQKVRQLAARDVNAIKRAISRQRPVAIGIPVYNSWYTSAVVRKYGNITVPLPGEVPLQIGHAVALVGYEDNPQFAGGGYFIVRNSWNANWGTASAFGPGYGTIPYRYIALYNWDAWCIIA